jgi:subtilisin
VGIVDTGSGPHKDVPISGGQNTVVGEDPKDFADNGDQHGTHVAGIVGARGPATRMSGYAPQCTLRAYRVFGKGKEGASNYSIAKAIDAAVADGCDIINMSLGSQGPADPATASAIADARAKGTVVVVASGNDSLHQVGQPAADPRAVAVGAFGRKGLYPNDSASADDVGKKSSKDKQLFMANFSNWGVEIDFAGTGVAIVSTVPGDQWAVMDGTSMACPSVTGAIARLLSANPAVMRMPRDQARSDAILQLAYAAAKPLGFGAEFEGNGWFGK